MLRDHLICGIRDACIRHLLGELDLTFKKAVDLAQASETAEKNSKQLHQQLSPQLVYVLQCLRNPTRQHITVSYYRCSGKHAMKECHCQDVVCHNCHKKGHLAQVCRSKPRSCCQTASSKNQPRQNTHHVAQGDEASLPSEKQAPNSAQEYPEYLYQLSDQRRSAQSLTMRMLLNAIEVEMEVDTGASTTIMSEAMYRRL